MTQFRLIDSLEYPSTSNFNTRSYPPISGVFRETHLGTWGRFEYISEQIDNDPSTDTQKHPKRITLDVNDMDYFQPLFQLVCCVVRPSTPKTHGAARPNIKTDDASGCASWKTWNASSFLFLGDPDEYSYEYEAHSSALATQETTFANCVPL